jgi:peptide/nickel transport system ATP-binding protein
MSASEMTAPTGDWSRRTGEPLLEVRDLTVTYRSGKSAKDTVYAARGVDLDLPVGGTFGMAGESGSGKTTVALSLLRLLPVSATVTGRIRFRGEELLEANWGRVRAVRWAGASVVFQGAMSALNPVRTVGEQIVEPIVLHEKVGEKAARARAQALLDSVGVPSRRIGSYPHELSGGQRQRVMIAMALACGPDLVIADEPTTALDVIVQAQILTLLTDLVRDRGISLLMISHDLSVLAQTCDRLGVMYAGRLVETGPSRQVIGAPLHPYTKALAGAFPTLGDPTSRLAPAGLDGDPPDLREHLEGCAFAPRCPLVHDRCLTGTIPLIDVGDRSAACVLVGDDTADVSPAEVTYR